jgi:ipoprotein LpqH
VKDRFVAAALTASVLVACSTSGCVPQEQKVPQKTARITVNGNTRTSHAVSCTQVQWLLTADVSAAPARVKVLLRLGPEKPKPESVHIDNFNGFTGVADTGVGSAVAAFAGNKYIITGKAEQTNADNPNTPTTAAFKIEVEC